MTSSMTRRDFLSLKTLFSVFENTSNNLSSEMRKKESMEHYFQSPMYSYPLLQEMPWELLVEEANRKGIATEGRSKNDIARDLFSDL